MTGSEGLGLTGIQLIFNDGIKSPGINYSRYVQHKTYTIDSDEEIAEILMKEFGIDLNVKDHNGKTGFDALALSWPEKIEEMDVDQ